MYAIHRSSSIVTISVLSAAFVAAAIWLYNTKYSTSPKNTASPTVAVITPSSSQETPPVPTPDSSQGDYVVRRRYSARSSHPASPAKFTPRVRIMKRLTFHDNTGPGSVAFQLELERAEDEEEFLNMEQGYLMALNNLTYSLNTTIHPVTSTTKLDTTKVAWSTRNLTKLVEALRSLYAMPAIDQRCDDLTVEFPATKITVDDPFPGALHLPSYLERLSWTGFRDLVPVFIQPPTVSNLTHLTLECDILTLEDCSSVLLLGRQRLRSVTFCTIRRSCQAQASMQIFPHIDIKGLTKITLEALESLNITSTVDIHNLLFNFEFLKINTITLKISDTEFDILSCRDNLTDCGRREPILWDVWCKMNEKEMFAMRSWYLDAELEPTCPLIL